MRSPLSLLLLAGCASAGDPWGVAELSLAAEFAPGADRLEDGKLRTSSSYLLEIEELTLAPSAVTLSVVEGGGDLSFDPANPPPGYSLCHSGHCHADDGRLVDYEIIEAELSGGGSAGFRLTLDATAPVPLGPERVEVPLTECEGECRLEPGSLGTLTVALRELTFRVRAFDATSAGRLPSEGEVFFATVPLEEAVTRALEGAVGEEEPIGFLVRGTLRVSPRLFDRIDWSAAGAGDVSGREAIRTQLVDNLLTSTLEVAIDRFDPES